MKNTLVRNRRAISPVIATVILVAVAITISIAVAYWMGGIAGGYTKFEKVEIATGYSTKVSGFGWNITLELRNTGSAASTMSRVFVNEVPIEQNNYGRIYYDAISDYIPTKVSTDISYSGTTIGSGEPTTVHIWISDTYSTLSSGTTVNVKIHSAGGMDYIKLIELV